MAPEIAITFSQTAARFNERASFAAAAAMDDNTMMRMQFAAQAQQQLESDTGDRLASTIAQLAGVINGRVLGAGDKVA
jgi:hypothetical protein